MLDLGLDLLVLGSFSFPKAEPLREVLKEMPMGKLLLETDFPYLALVPFRGKRKGRTGRCGSRSGDRGRSLRAASRRSGKDYYRECDAAFPVAGGGLETRLRKWGRFPSSPPAWIPACRGDDGFFSWGIPASPPAPRNVLQWGRFPSPLR